MIWHQSEAERQIEELWHNLYRMHSYVEAALPDRNGKRHGILKNADLLLRSSRARVESVLADTRRLEKLPVERSAT